MQRELPLPWTEQVKLMPFVRITLFFIAGILAEWWVLLVFPLFFFPKLSFLRLYLCVALTGAVLVQLHRQTRVLPEEETVSMTVVMRETLKRDYFEASLLSYSDTLRQRTVPADGTVVVSMDTALLRQFRYGDTLSFRAYVEPLYKDFPDVRSYRRSLWRQGFSQLAVYCGDEVLRVRSGRRFLLREISASARDFVMSRYAGLTVAKKDAGVLTAMVSGDRSELSKPLRTRYAHGGIAHILAISGLHVGIIALLLNLLLGWMNRIYQLRVCKTALIVVLLWGYALLTGLAPSVCRAALMFSLFQVAAFGVQSAVIRYNVLFAAAFLMLAVSPSLIYDIGFQLSFLAVYALFFFVPKIDACLPVASPVWRFVCLTVGATLAVQLVTQPLVSYHFGTFSWVSVLNNLLIALLMPVLLTAAFLYLLHPFAFVDKLLVFCFQLIDDTLDFTLSLPGAIVTERYLSLPGLAMSLCGLAGLLAAAEYGYVRYLRRNRFVTGMKRRG